MAQVVVVNVSALSKEESNDRVGVVLQKDADNETFYNLTVELKNHSDKVGATSAIADRKKNKSDTDIMDDAFAKLEEAKKMGLISEAEIQKMKAEMGAQMKEDAEKQSKVAKMAAGPGSSNPSALKERIRGYCIGKRFFYAASKVTVDSMVRVEAKTTDGKKYMGFIDATTGRVVIEPDRYIAFNRSIAGKGFNFTKDGYIIAHMADKVVMINKTGRVILDNGYKALGFYNDCRILKAANAERKVGIIDYQGNVLEPFVHNSFQSESLAKAANRIFKEKGGVKVEIW